MCNLFKLTISIYLFINIIQCTDDYSESDYDLFDFVDDHNLDKLINLIDTELIGLNQKVDNVIIDFDSYTIKPLESSLIQTSSILPNPIFANSMLPDSTISSSMPNSMSNLNLPNRFFSSAHTESDAEFRKKIINKIERQIKADLDEYKFTKATKLSYLRRHLLVEHDRLNDLERIRSGSKLDLIQTSLTEHISWFTNFSEHQFEKENKPVEEEYIDGNGLVDILIGLVNKKLVYPNQPYKIKKNKSNVVYSLKPFVILDATIESRNRSEKVAILRSSPFYLKNNVNEKLYILKGNLSLQLVLNMRNQFELLYNYVFNTIIDTNLIGTVEIRYFYDLLQFDITIIEISDFEHFEITNNFNFIQGLLINPVLNTFKNRIMDAIKIEANKFLKKLVTPLKMKYIFDIIK